MAFDSSLRFQTEFIGALCSHCAGKHERAELAKEMNDLKPVYMREPYRSEQRRRQEQAEHDEAVSRFMGQLFGIDPGEDAVL